MLLGFQPWYLARHFFGISHYHIETERIFSVAGVLTSLHRCRLSLSIVYGLIVIYKNWPTNVRNTCELASTMLWSMRSLMTMRMS